METLTLIQDRFTASQAVAKMASVGPGVQLVDFRVFRRIYEIVPGLKAPEPPQLLTGQGQDVKELNIQVATEFKTILPLKERHPDDITDVALSLALQVGVAYQFPAEIVDDERLIFAKIGSVMTAWPYWRVFLHTSTAEAGMQAHVAALIPPIEAAKMAGFPESLAR